MICTGIPIANVLTKAEEALERQGSTDRGNPCGLCSVYENDGETNYEELDVDATAATRFNHMG